MLMFLSMRRSLRVLNFQLAITVFEFNFSARGMVCLREIQVHLTFFVVRARLETNPKRESISLRVDLLCDLFLVVKSMLTKSLCLLCRLLSVWFLVLISITSCLWMQQSMVLKWLSMESGLQQTCKASFPRSMHNDSTLRANSGLRCYQMSDSRFSSARIAFWVGFRFQSAAIPLFILSVVSGNRRWRCLPMSLGSFIGSMIVIFSLSCLGLGTNANVMILCNKIAQAPPNNCGWRFLQRLDWLVCRWSDRRSASGLLTSVDAASHGETLQRIRRRKVESLFLGKTLESCRSEIGVLSWLSHSTAQFRLWWGLICWCRWRKVSLRRTLQMRDDLFCLIWKSDLAKWGASQERI